MKLMRIEDFEDILDRQGCNLDAWPEETAALARDLLAHSVAARQMLQEAQALDGLFAQAAPVRAPAGLASRIVREATAPEQASVPEAAPIMPMRTLARPPLRPFEWLREIGSAVFHSDAMARPVAVLAICFVSGIAFSYALSDDTNNLLAAKALPTFFTYFDLS